MTMPLIPGMTETARDAEPIAFELMDVLERNPALALAQPMEIMKVVGQIADNRATVNGSVASALEKLQTAFMRESDTDARVKIARIIAELRHDDDDTDDADEK